MASGSASRSWGFESENEYAFAFAGNSEPLGKPQLLAVPRIDESAEQTDIHLTLCADPFLTSYFFLPSQKKIGRFSCASLGEVGIGGLEKRTLYTIVRHGDDKTAMDAFYVSVLSDVKPGPEWLMRWRWTIS